MSKKDTATSDEEYNVTDLSEKCINSLQEEIDLKADRRTKLKPLKPIYPSFCVTEFVRPVSYRNAINSAPPSGYVDWDKDVLSKRQTVYIEKQLYEIEKCNKQYLDDHPEVEAIIGMVTRAVFSAKPDDVNKFIKHFFKDPLFPAKVQLYMNENKKRRINMRKLFKQDKVAKRCGKSKQRKKIKKKSIRLKEKLKAEKLILHDLEVERCGEQILEDYRDLLYQKGCFRSELKLLPPVKKIFKKTHWKEPYPDYYIKKVNTLKYTIPHHIKYHQFRTPIKPTF